MIGLITDILQDELFIKTTLTFLICLLMYIIYRNELKE